MKTFSLVHKYLTQDDVFTHDEKEKIVLIKLKPETNFYRSKVKFYSSQISRGHHEKVLYDDIYKKFPVIYRVNYETSTVTEYYSIPRSRYEEKIDNLRNLISY